MTDEKQLGAERLFEEVPLQLAAEELDRKFIAAIKVEDDSAVADGALESGDEAVATPVKPIGEPQDASQAADQQPVIRRKSVKGLMLPLGKRLAVIPGNVRDDLAFTRSEAKQIGVADQVVGMLVMARIVDEIAHVMQDGRRLEQPPCLLAKTVDRIEGIKDCQ